MAADADLTRILLAIERGAAKATDELLPLVHDELRAIARRHLARERPGATLQATALVHEAWLRLGGGEAVARVVGLCEAWHAAEPAAERAAKLAEWRRKVAAAAPN